MVWPTSVITREISFGKALVLETSEDLSLSVITRASRSLVSMGEGFRMETMSASFESADAGEEIIFPLPVTDQSGWMDPVTRKAIEIGPDQHSHLYTTTLTIRKGTAVVNTYKVGPYPIPQGVGPIDGDTMLVSDEAQPGVLITIPEAWQQIIDSANLIVSEGLDGAMASYVDSGGEFDAKLNTKVSDVAASDMSNPESLLNGETVEVVQGVLGGGVEGLIRTVNAVGDLATPRPAWAGVVLWLVDAGDAEPAYFQAGDIVAEVAEVAWTPGMGVAGMVGWFDASILAPGALATWSNLTVGSDLIAASEPTVVADKIGTRSAVVSDGVDDYMEMTLATPYTGPVSVFAVAGTNSADNPAGTDFLWNAASASGTDQRASLARNTDEAYVTNRNVGASFALTSANGAFTAGVHVIEARYDGADSYIHVDGVDVASGNMGASAPEIAKWGILARNATSNFEAFFVGEMLIVHGSVTPTTRTRILAYLTDKWVP